MSKVPKSLQDEWDKKLAESGFVDIEKKQIFEGSRITSRIRNYNFMVDEQMSYYQKAWDFLELYDFKDIKHKQIWALHCNGVTVREIATTVRLAKSQVDRVIQKYKKIMLGAY